MATKFPREQVLKLAVAALDFNKGSVERQPVKIPGMEIIPNRVIVEQCLEGKMHLPITQDQQQRAENLVTYLQQVKIMQTLRSERNQSFLDSVLALLEKDEFDRRDFGLLVWAPKLAEDYNKKEKEYQQIGELQNQSRYIGKIGSTIIVDFELLNYKQIAQIGNYVVTGHDGHGNIVSYWAKHKENIHPRCRMRARVKSHNESDYHQQARVTHLNYVKVLKDTDEK